MATITVKNLGSSILFLRDFYKTLGASGQTNTSVGPTDTMTLNSNVTGNSLNQGGNFQMQHFPLDVAKMGQIQSLVAAGTITVTVTPSADELASGLTAGLDSIGFKALQEVGSVATTASPIFNIRIPLASGGSGGTADDTTIYALGALPFAFRILDAHAIINNTVGGSSLQIWSHTSAAGTKLSGTVSGATAGLARWADTGVTATVQTPISGTDGVFLHRSDRSVTGEMVLVCRRETAGS